METRIQVGGSYGDKTPLPSPPPRGGSIETEILFNTEIEKTILASILFREHSDFFLLSEIVRPEFFYDKQMAKLYGVLKKRFEQQKPMTDFEMVARDMQEAGEKDFTVIDIVRLTENNPLVMDMEEYALALRDLYQRRQLKYSLISLLEKVNDRTQNLVQTLQVAVKQLLSDDIISTKNTLNITEVLTKLKETIQNNFEQKIQQGLLTGFERLDRFGGYWWLPKIKDFSIVFYTENQLLTKSCPEVGSSRGTKMGQNLLKTYLAIFFHDVHVIKDLCVSFAKVHNYCETNEGIPLNLSFAVHFSPTCTDNGIFG